jgi:DNA-binding CsgD family transcriptional regulator
VSWAHDWVPFQDLKNTEFYDGFIRPQDDVATGFASTLFREKDRFLVLVGNVAYRFLPEAEQAARSLQTMGPHLRRAFELYRRIEGQALSNRVMAQALDQLSAALFVVDRRAQVLFANKEAESVAKRGDVVRTGIDRRLRFVSAKDENAVAEHIARCRSGAAPSNLFIRLQKPVDSPFVAFISPAPVNNLVALVSPRPDVGSPLFLIFLVDPRREPQTDAEALSATLGITATEALLAFALLKDKSLRDYAEERSISNHTARAQLKSLMAKTDTHRQAELVNLLSRTLATVRLTRS